MKTQKEVRTFLLGKGYLGDICDYVIGKMKEYGYLDDGAYSKAYLENAKQRKGSRLIAMELKRKGVSDEEIEEALETLTGETETALKILQKYLRGKPLDRKNLQKGYAYLIGKGFDYETAKEALRKLGCEDED